MYITYITTNLITNEFYIGSHKLESDNDTYLGSGKLLRESIEKYGSENFRRDIIQEFETREESIKLEHELIKEKKKDNLCLNMSYGGLSFDYINQNLQFDRAYFGSLANHDWSHIIRAKNIAEYLKNPKKCEQCKKDLPYDIRNNRFCSHSCSATYNNYNRPLKVYPAKYCANCKTHIIIGRRKFCSDECMNTFLQKNKQRTKLQEKLLTNKSEIKSMHDNGKSYREIGKLFETSGNTIKDLLKGRIK